MSDEPVVEQAANDLEQLPEIEKANQETAAPKRKNPFIMSVDSANEQIKDLLEHYEVDFEAKFPDDSDELKAFNMLKTDMIGGIRRGKIQFEQDNGFNIIQVLQTGTRIKYRELDGDSKVMMGKYKNHTQKVYALLAAMTGDLDTLNVRKFKGPDNSRCELIGTFLLLL